MEACLAVDVGGTKMAAALIDRDGHVLARAQAETPARGDQEAVFAAITHVIEQVRTASPAAPIACGVGCGGPMEPGGDHVSPLHIPSWRAFPLRGRLRALTGLDVFVDNDAKALAMAEGWVGAARGHDSFIGMVVSTGIGGGIVLNGRLLDGHSGNAGHIGHVIVEPDGRPCFCGGRGCLEAEASGRAIAEIIGGRAEDAPAEVRRRTGTLVGRAVASVANLLDLQLAVVGGSVALGYAEDFFDAARQEIAARSRLSFSTNTAIVPAALDADAPLIGAGAVGWRGAGLPVAGPG